MTLALLFPGQGSQRPNMLHTLPASAAVNAVVDESVSALADLGLTADIDTDAALSNTTNTQLALLIAGVACARALIEDDQLTPQFVAGHSVGGFAAAVSAGVLTLPEAIGAAAVRGRAMEAACADGSWGMAALTGLPVRDARRLVADISTDRDPLWIANINSATQTVLSGTDRALTQVADAARSAGASDCRRLDIAVASHCPLQADSAAQVAEYLAPLPRRTPTARYLTNVGGRAVDTATAILDDLAASVTHPVRWYDAMRLMGELGATCAVETQPGRTLTRLMTAALPSVVVVSLQDVPVASASAWIRHYLSKGR